MVRSRRGSGKLGCLFSLLVVVAVAYFAVNIGEVYWRYYRFQDAMEQEARFATSRTDDAIRRRLATFADSLGLPEQATHIRVERRRDGIQISADYSERVELPLFVREFRFTPTAPSDR